MTPTPSFRDVEKLSAYLDGQLSKAEAIRLQARLESDPDLRTILDDLRQARGLLRKLPHRRAPRNFTLTPKMVGQKPPMPRAYPFFRFATALAMLLLTFTLTINFISPHLVRQAAPVAYGIGGGAGGGGGAEEDTTPSYAMEAPSEAPPAATEAPAAPELAPAPTEMPPEAGDTNRVAPTIESLQKEGTSQEATLQPEAPTPPTTKSAKPIPAAWQIVLAALVLVNLVIIFIMRQSAKSKWRDQK